MKGEGGIPIDVGPSILRQNIVLLLFIIVYSPQSPTPFWLWLSGKTKNILIIVLFFGFTSPPPCHWPLSVAFQYASHFYYCIYFKRNFGRTICRVHAVRAVTKRRKKIKINMRINRERRFHDLSSFIPILLLYATADMPYYTISALLLLAFSKKYLWTRRSMP